MAIGEDAKRRQELADGPSVILTLDQELLKLGYVVPVTTDGHRVKRVRECRIIARHNELTIVQLEILMPPPYVKPDENRNVSA